jgi:hypothetical protein
MNLAYVEGELKGLSNVGDRAVLTRIFRNILKDVRFGHPKGTIPDPMVNMGGGFFYATTPAVANTEFAIVHDFGRVPYLLIPVLPLDEVNTQIVRLKTTRAADATRIYLSSPDVNAPIAFAVEG